MIRNYLPTDDAAMLDLWNCAGVHCGYAPLTAEAFDALLLKHPDFSPEYTFVLEEGTILGFVSGCTGNHIPRGDVRGYLSCLLLAEDADTDENTALLLDALENAFRRAGRSQCAVTFFNPIRLPWIIPGTGDHQHNNAPGVAVDLPLHGRMLAGGYREAARECAMYLDLSDFRTPDWVEEKALRMAREGNTCAGFTGPIYPEKSGRGYFAGIGVAPAYERHGLGNLLFYRLLQREKEAGARYMSLFTGENNHAKQIYLGAGFRVVRKFGVMLKEL